jgi:hypothetical protein
VSVSSSSASSKRCDACCHARMRRNDLKASDCAVDRRGTDQAWTKNGAVRSRPGRAGSLHPDAQPCSRESPRRWHHAHDDSGAPTITRPRHALDYPALKSYALASDFEGVVTLALGLHDTTSIRVGELPGLLYIEVRA